MALDKISIYEKNLTRIHEWIRAVDQKLSVLMAIQGVYIVFITPLFLSLLSRKYLHVGSLLAAGILVSYAVLAYGLLKCFISLYSSLKVKGQSVTEDQLSLTYFNHIEKMTLENYKKKMRSLTSKKYDDELLTQIHTSSTIATKKHRRFNDALFLFIVGALLSAITLCFLYLI
ncbi:hypothetical protein EB118_14015 [bacterium]|nr:hypothetical protein [bacterium]NBX98332.1 hypothetical protein [bacterium]NDG31171.1 hypothetical protein [bacterium]